MSPLRDADNKSEESLFGDCVPHADDWKEISHINGKQFINIDNLRRTSRRMFAFDFLLLFSIHIHSIYFCYARRWNRIRAQGCASPLSQADFLFIRIKSLAIGPPNYMKFK